MCSTPARPVCTITLCFLCPKPFSVQNLFRHDSALHVLLMLGFSARAGSRSARWNRTAASMWLMALQSLCLPMGRSFPHLQKQQDECPSKPWRWEDPWWGPSLCTAAALLCTELHWDTQKDEVALLPKLHLQRVVAHHSCKTYSENFSSPSSSRRSPKSSCGGFAGVLSC